MTIVPRLLPALALGLVVAVVAGCDSEPIRTRSEPRHEDVNSGPVRVLAAIVPVEGETWFFKMVGRTDIITITEPAFRQIIQSLDFPGKGEKVTWITPKGWKETRGEKGGMAGERKAVLQPEGAPGPQLVISTLRGTTAANIKQNVDRWRRVDLGLAPVSSERALKRFAQPQTVKGHTVTVVDMSGPGAETKAPPTPRPPVTRPKPGGSKGLKFDLPATWKQVQGSQMAYATFVVGEAQLKVTRIGGGELLGGFRPNLERWRAEAGLRSTTAEDLARAKPVPVAVDGARGKQLDIQGPDLLLRVLWVERGGATWYIKFVGPTATVRKELAHFDSFIKSLKFTGAADE